MKLDDVLKGSYQRYIAADFLSTVFFNKRIPLVIDGVEKSNANDIKQNFSMCTAISNSPSKRTARTNAF